MTATRQRDAHLDPALIERLAAGLEVRCQQ